MLEIFKISLLKLFLPQNSIRVHVGPRDFATLQIELYCVVDYDSKWSTKFHKDCMLEKNISLLGRLLIIIKNAKMAGPQILQHSKMNWTMQWTIIASSLPIFMTIVCWKIILVQLFSMLKYCG